ncbi:MAG: hypothetical protein A3A31_00380 [Candidatus Zambryskibacteria bacterium RIFCSPLOWO2_01_FULL_48_25]|nr:MAG: hypothetical protein A3A31_00380 [Candidatus Zambryskibacteria bacterium RIFCSPLOWO2_01_FULL_48_25]
MLHYAAMLHYNDTYGFREQKCCCVRTGGRGKRNTTFLFGIFCGVFREAKSEWRRLSKRGRGGRGVWGEFRHARADRIVAPLPARILGGQNTKEKYPFLFRRNWSRTNPKSKEHFSLVSAESARRWRGVLIRGGSPQNGF